MKFSPQQEKALAAVAVWLQGQRSPVFRLFGYAGTGKTTLARYFTETVDGTVQFAAFYRQGGAGSALQGGRQMRVPFHSLI